MAAVVVLVALGTSACTGAPPTVSTSALSVATRGSAYAATLSVGGGRSPYTWSSKGLPSGLKLSGNKISGTPTAAGHFSVKVRVTDVVRGTSARYLDLVVITPEQAEAARLMNADRKANGVAMISFNGGLDAAAQAFAAKMGASHSIDHPAPSTWVPKCATAWGENLGYNTTLANIERGFMSSKRHHDNIVNPMYTKIATGVAFVDGRYWVVQRFTRGC